MFISSTPFVFICCVEQVYLIEKNVTSFSNFFHGNPLALTIREC